MALANSVLNRNCFYIYNITQPVRRTIQINNSLRVLASGICYRNNFKQTLDVKQVSLTSENRQCSTQRQDCSKPPTASEPEEKKGLVKRFKEMYRDYWYVVLPVHMCTSAIWFAGFYYAVRSGVDVIAILEALGVSEKLMTPLRESNAGYFALAFALYKLATPLRYAVTVGGTTIAIKKLTTIGWIKPVPSRERIKEMFQEKKDNIQDRFKESKQHYQVQMKEKKIQILDDMRRYKSEIRNIKSKVKKM